MIIICGIDPGLSGAISFYIPSECKIAVYDMPVIAREISPSHLAGLVRQYAPTFAVIEDVHSMPKNGGKSMFSFGRSVGEARGVLGALGIPLHQVSPNKWKKYFGLGKDKDESRLEAVRLFPDKADDLKRKKDDGRAEAMLIAYWGHHHIAFGERVA